MKRVLRILIFLLILNSFILVGFLVSNHTGSVIQDTKLEYANLTNVVDGDTIDTNLGRVRLLGINTPESKHAGYQEPKDYLTRFIGKQIELEMIKEDKDQYGRLLRYIFYNNQMLNKQILENGWAHFYTYNEDKYTPSLRQAEANARVSQLGIWQKSTNVCAKCVNLVKLNEIDPGEYLILGNNCSFVCSLDGWTVNDDSSSHEKKLNFIIPASSEHRIDYNGSIWNDAGDSLYLRDKAGLLVLFYRY